MGAFPDSVISETWVRSGGRCECMRLGHGHEGTHGAPLLYSARGQDAPGGWEPHHVDPFGPEVLGNCEILCKLCHDLTLRYGA